MEGKLLYENTYNRFSPEEQSYFLGEIQLYIQFAHGKCYYEYLYSQFSEDGGRGGGTTRRKSYSLTGQEQVALFVRIRLTESRCSKVALNVTEYARSSRAVV